MSFASYRGKLQAQLDGVKTTTVRLVGRAHTLEGRWRLREEHRDDS